MTGRQVAAATGEAEMTETEIARTVVDEAIQRIGHTADINHLIALMMRNRVVDTVFILEVVEREEVVAAVEVEVDINNERRIDGVINVAQHRRRH